MPIVATAAIELEGHMAKFHLKKSECVQLTRELAQRFATMEGSPTERDPNDARIKYLAQQAGLGKLVTFHWATAELNGTTMRMNGQHSSNMLCGLNGFFPDGLYVHLDHYEVDDEVGLADLFRTFDSRKSSRTPLDVSGAYQGLYPALRGLNKRTAKLGIEGIGWHQREVIGADVPSDDDRYLMFDKPAYHRFLQFVDTVIGPNTPELQRVPVVAAIYATFIKNETAAKQFWAEVAEGGDEISENQQYRLDSWLKETKDRESGVHLKPAQFYQGTVFAWNAYRTERPIKDIRCTVDKKKGLAEPIE